MSETRMILSHSALGKGIKIVATASVGTSIHSTSTSDTDIDLVWLYAVNTDSSDRKLTIQWGDTTDPDCLIEKTITAESGPVLVVDGLPLTGSGTIASAITAFAATANVMMIYGHVIRYGPG
jgi:hypothetical protein